MNYRKHRLTIPTNDEYSGAQVKMLIREINIIVEKEITNSFWDAL